MVWCRSRDYCWTPEECKRWKNSQAGFICSSASRAVVQDPARQSQVCDCSDRRFCSFDASPSRYVRVPPLSTRVDYTLTVHLAGQGACQAIESGFALAHVLRFWRDNDLESALHFFQDFRKPRTDRITQTSYETGKLASVDVPEDEWTDRCEPAKIKERMRWVMEYDLMGELEVALKRRDQLGRCKLS